MLRGGGRGGRGGRRGGPIGGLISLVGQGVGLAQEYKEHRKDQRKARSASQQDLSSTRSRDPSATPPEPARGVPEDAPPAYEHIAAQSEVSLQSGQPRPSDAKDEPERWEDDTSDSDIGKCIPCGRLRGLGIRRGTYAE